MKNLFFILIKILVCLNIFAQDTAALKRFSLPRGIYYSSKTFFEKKPDIDKPFEVLVNNGSGSGNGLADHGYSFKVDDSIKITQDVFGFYDGKDMYIRVDNGVRRNGPGIYTVDVIKIDEFFKLSGLGRFPYIFIKSASFFKQQHRIAIETTDTAFLTNINRIELYYFSRKRQLIKATPDGIGFLLKGDKDLYESYGNEPRKSTEVLRKYLDKLNERYPDL